MASRSGVLLAWVFACGCGAPDAEARARQFQDCESRVDQRDHLLERAVVVSECLVAEFAWDADSADSVAVFETGASGSDAARIARGAGEAELRGLASAQSEYYDMTGRYSPDIEDVSPTTSPFITIDVGDSTGWHATLVAPYRDPALLCEIFDGAGRAARIPARVDTAWPHLPGVPYCGVMRSVELLRQWRRTR